MQDECRVRVVPLPDNLQPEGARQRSQDNHATSMARVLFHVKYAAFFIVFIVREGLEAYKRDRMPRRPRPHPVASLQRLDPAEAVDIHRASKFVAHLHETGCTERAPAPCRFVSPWKPMGWQRASEQSQLPSADDAR